MYGINSCIGFIDIQDLLMFRIEACMGFIHVWDQLINARCLLAKGGQNTLHKILVCLYHFFWCVSINSPYLAQLRCLVHLSFVNALSPLSFSTTIGFPLVLLHQHQLHSVHSAGAIRQLRGASLLLCQAMISELSATKNKSLRGLSNASSGILAQLPSDQDGLASKWSKARPVFSSEATYSSIRDWSRNKDSRANILNLGGPVQ